MGQSELNVGETKDRDGANYATDCREDDHSASADFEPFTCRNRSTDRPMYARPCALGTATAPAEQSASVQALPV